MATSSEKEAWTLDQLTKSEFFHQKLHDWKMLEVAQCIEQIKGEEYEWNREKLGISQKAWERVIHRGIKPVIVFAHPLVLVRIPRAIGYYRMLAMVSQKSMARVGLSGNRYEAGLALPDEQTAWTIAQRLNEIISHLIEADESIDVREFDLWRGMAAGSQAQGSWQNTKGTRVEERVKRMFQHRIRERGLVSGETSGGSRIELVDGRTVILSEEPDIGFYRGTQITAAVEVKGGIDTAGVFERIGAAIKSLHRVKVENPGATTVLILQGVSVTEQAREDLERNKDAIDVWFAVENVLNEEPTRVRLFELLGI